MNMKSLSLMPDSKVIATSVYIFSFTVLVIIVVVLNVQLKAECQQFRTDFEDELSKSDTKMEDELITLKDDLRKGNKLITYQKIELKNLQGELHMSNKLIADQKIELTSMKDTSSVVFNRLHQQNAHFSDELSQYSMHISGQNTEIPKLKDDLRNSNNLISGQQIKLTKLNDDLRITNNLISSQEIELTKLQNKLSYTNNLISRQETEITKLNDDLRNTSNLISSQETEIIKLKETQDLFKKFLSIGQSCHQLLAKGQTSNGVYTITGGGAPFEAYCNQVAGGYMVFQRRYDGSTDFWQYFQPYVDGFGNLDGEYWLGLEKLYQLTKSGKHQLRVDLVAYDNTTAYAVYEDFSIGAGPGYRLHVGQYNGTAGDSLAYHNNMNFTTLDNDADLNNLGNCAADSQGAFWFKNCRVVNLNAFVYEKDDKNPSLGMVWAGFNGGNPVKATSMMVL